MDKWNSLAKALDARQWKVFEGKSPLSAEATRAIQNAIAVVSHLHSNAVVIADGLGTLGIGVGFVNRVDAIKHASMHAVQGAGSKKNTQKARGPWVLASDGFMPFADNIDAACEVGVQFVVQPGGSKKDEEVIAACRQKGITLVLTGHRVFFHGI